MIKYMTRLGLACAFCLSAFSGQAQHLFTVNDQTVSSDEFKYIYKKNSFNNDDAFTKKDIKEYFDLYIKFKLKVTEARSLELDKDPALLSEFETYKEQLQKPYFSDDSVKEALIDQAYERLKEEVRASHILVRVDADAAPEDTLAAWQKIDALRNRVISGEPFPNLARMYSEDPSARQNAGDLGYFSSMQMVYPFEEAAYNLGIGEVSQPIRTQFGYHIIQLQDRRKSAGKVRVAHIMLRFRRNMTPADSSQLKAKAKMIQEELQKGTPWDELTKMYSEDQQSANNGGELRPFGVGVMPPPFGDISFSLEEPNDISEPFTTAFGWHLVKLLEKIQLPEKEVMKKDIEARISSDGRSSLQEKVLIDRLKRENGYSENPETIQGFLKGEPLEENPWLIKVGNETLYVEDARRDLGIGISEDRWEKWVNEKIIQQEEELLGEKYPEYRFLSNEYWEGILLFQIMNEKVWNKASEDSLGLSIYFENHRKDYYWKERANGFFLNTSSPEVFQSAKKILADNAQGSYSAIIDSLSVNLEGLYQLNEGPFEKGDNNLPKGLKWESGSQTLSTDSSYEIWYITDILDAEPKELQEVRGKVISDYQNWLDKKWVEELESKYTVKINKKSLRNVIKELTK